MKASALRWLAVVRTPLKAVEVSHLELTDEALLYAVARGDREALAAIYCRHVHVMLALARRILRDASDAEDVVHDVFVEAWRHAGDYQPDRASVRTWLLLRLRSRCLDRVRALALRRRALTEEIAEESVLFYEAHHGDGDHVRVRTALEQLSDEQRRVLELGYFQGMSCQEMAQFLGIPVGTVKSRLSAAIGRLRRSFSAASEEGTP